MLSINEKFSQVRKLGQGSFGLVWQAEDKETRQQWALKVVKLVKLDESYDIEKAKREVDNVQEIWKNGALDPRRRYIIQIADAWQLPDPHDRKIRSWIDELWLDDAPPVGRLYVIQMEFCNHKSLQNWLKNPKTNGNLDEGRKIFDQIAQGLSFLHDHSCIHRDLKPGNILLTKVNEGGSEVVVAKIGDFGSSRIRLPNSKSILTSAIGTDVYASPEQLSGQKSPGGFGVDYTTKSDIFSLGVILFCLHSPLKSFGQQAQLLYYQHLEGFRQEDTKIPADFCAQFPKETVLLRRMLSNDPDGRPTAHEIISNFFILHPDLLGSKTQSGHSPADEPVDMELDTKLDETICIEKFDESEKNELLTLISSQSNQFDSLKVLKLDIKLVADWKILMAFLELTASFSNSPKLNLKVDTIQFSSESPKSSIKFGQLTTLHFESLEEETQLLCLINIVQNSPNLLQLSIGHFAYYLASAKNSHGNISKFLRMVSLRNLEFSCGFLDNPELTKELFVQLKGNGVVVKKLGFNWNTNPQESKIIDLIQGDLEEIHYLHHDQPTPTFQCRLDKLKILGIYCNFNILQGVLKKTPNVQKLFLYTSTESRSVIEQISLPHLTSLSVFMCTKEDPDQLAKMFANCPNLSRLTCINHAKASMAPIYEKFRHIKKFRYLHRGGVRMENVVGMAESALTAQHLNHWIQNRPPYIGHFKELTSLSFGYKDYQDMYLVANWDLDMKVFTHGIGHLTKLNKLCLPPTMLGNAKNILTSLISSGMAQLQLVQLQVWAGNDAGYSGTMKSLDVEGLAGEYAHRFKVMVKPVRREAQNRYCDF